MSFFFIKCTPSKGILNFCVLQCYLQMHIQYCTLPLPLFMILLVFTVLTVVIQLSEQLLKNISLGWEVVGITILRSELKVNGSWQVCNILIWLLLCWVPWPTLLVILRNNKISIYNTVLLGIFWWCGVMKSEI